MTATLDEPFVRSRALVSRSGRGGPIILGPVTLGALKAAFLGPVSVRVLLARWLHGDMRSYTSE